MEIELAELGDRGDRERIPIEALHAFVLEPDRAHEAAACALHGLRDAFETDLGAGGHVML